MNQPRSILLFAAVFMNLVAGLPLHAQVWALKEYPDRVRNHLGHLVPTNAIVQLLGYVGTGTVFDPPVDFGTVTGTDAEWKVYDVAKVPRPGMIIGVYTGSFQQTFRETMRIIVPDASYTGNGYTLPNPSVSGGLWVGHVKFPVPIRSHLGYETINLQWAFYPLDGARDADGDQLPDAWEWEHFQNPTNAIAGQDDDGDGVVNRDEALARTDPRDPHSYLKVTASSGGIPGQGMNLSWMAQSNVLYGVECLTNLVDAGQPLLIVSNVIVPATSLYETNVPDAAQSACYRLVIFP